MTFDKKYFQNGGILIIFRQIFPKLYLGFWDKENVLEKSKNDKKI